MLRSFFFSRVWALDAGTGGGGTASAGDGGSGAAAPASVAGASSGAGNPGGAGGAASGSAAPPPAAFADSLPADIREMAVFKDIKDVGGLARSYVNAAKMVGMDKSRIVALPASPDDADGWKGVYDALGRPEAPDKYGFKAPEGVTVDPKLQEGFASRAHELGLSAKQANALYDWWNGEAATANAAMAARSGEARAKAEAALRTEFGAAYDQNIALAQKAVEHYGSPEIRAELEAGLGNSPNLVKMFAKLGRGLSEDGLIGKVNGAGSDVLSSPTEAKQQINAKQADAEFMKAYMTKTHPGHAAAIATMKGLYEQAFPSAA